MALTRGARERYGIFVHEPDGDMGYGRIVGPFYSESAAHRRADAIERKAGGMHSYVECTVLPLLPGATSAKDVLEWVAS